ncbi:muramidase family protein [Gelidibacter pelagius]|uniref:LysM peptidoglycan-binding domain-containing protein n=1 Tax=Gelidibacter pelagius TaxID=2819985 RepID=A0ABS3STA7_9FLAO|nr:LysM peptidoglycan-binding domain-containing protein [Gelidibacter pelagius]MBO3098939.1 LysM peptidoglycan-binding domain-containing protein [Gelidibacter pelagius]
MKRLFQCFTLLFLCFNTSIAQESLKKHTVSSGETLFSIAKKYNVTPYDLQKVNPDVINGVKVDEVLLIPESKIKTPVLESAADSIKASVTTSSISYTVKTGETKYSLSKRFGLTITQLESQNPQIIQGLNVGDVLEIYPATSYVAPKRSSNTATPSVSSTTSSQTSGPSHNGKRHLVTRGETLVRIANANGLTVDQLTNANSRILANGLMVGQNLWIPGREQLNSGDAYSHVVKTGDTKFGLSLRFNTTIAALERKNPHIKTTLQIGQTVSMASEESISEPTTEISQKETKTAPSTTKPSVEVSEVEKTKTVPTITETVATNQDQVDKTETVSTVKKSVEVIEEKTHQTETVPKVEKVNVVTTKEKQPKPTKNAPTTKEVAATTKEKVEKTKTVPPVKKSIVSNEEKVKATKTVPTTTKEKVEQIEENVAPVKEAVVSTEEKAKATETVPPIKETVAVEQPKVVETSPTIAEPIATIEKKAEKTVATTTQPKEKIKTITETNISTSSETGYLPYEIQPNDTLYALAQKAGMTIPDFLVLNPQLKEAVQAGTFIKMPDAATPLHAPSETIETPELVRDFSLPVNLITTANTSQLKQLLFFLPFSKEEYQNHEATNDNFTSVSDDFKRVHLEFYKGANIAIDSIRKMYLSLNVDVIEAQSSIRSSKIKPLLEEHKINDYDAIILPFYDTVEEEVAAFTADNKIPVITASTMTFQNTTDNLYSAVPSANLQRKKMLDYIMTKDAHIIVLNDAHRSESKAFISEYAPNAEFVNIKKNGSFSEAELIGKFKKDQLNFVVIDSERTSVFLNTTNVLLSELSSHALQLAVLESALIPDDGHVSEKRYRILNMVFPSLIPEKSTASSKQFLSSYQKKYNLLPSANVMLGFDITFDSLLRLIQKQSFENSAVNDITEYTQLKFNYEKNILGGFSNEGIYILQYDSDANIREAN